MNVEDMAKRIAALEEQVKALQQSQPMQYICCACGAHLAGHQVQTHGCPATASPTIRLIGSLQQRGGWLHD